MCLITPAAAAGVLFFCDPASGSLFPPCPFHWLTGLYCPGCGSLRALHALLHGRLFAALALNPLMVLCLPFVIYGLTAQALLDWFGKRLPVPRIAAGWIWALLILIIAYWIARNIPLFPFTLLAPHTI